MIKSFEHVRKVVSLLGKNERRRLSFVMVGAAVLAMLEVVGVGTIMPFVAVASQPDLIRTNEYLRWAYRTFHFASDRDFLIVLGVLMFLFTIITNASHALLQYIKIRFTTMRRHSLSIKLLRTYLGQDYPFFLNRNSHDFIKNINSEIELMVTGTLMQLVEALARAIQIFLLAIFLFIINPVSTLWIAVAIFLIYGVIYRLIRRTLKRLGSERFALNAERNRIVSEAFWGIKEVKITGIEREFVTSMEGPSRRLALNTTFDEVIGDVPKYVLETVAFSAIIFIVLYMVLKSGNFQAAAASVSLYAYAGYRLMPAVQNLFKAISKLKYSAPAAERLVEEFKLGAVAKPLVATPTERLPFNRNLELSHITFYYPNAERPVIADLSLEIESNQLIGFAGKTGSGKTTLVDIILGLLKTENGTMRVDGVEIAEENLRSWQANLGYVPQNIYLSSDSIATNIAFGVPKGSIDHDSVRAAARLAQIDDFIENELPEQYQTAIGERGIRLSGGQRQRIGIARALYRNPSVLVMDEATSALDQQTERAVMDAIDGLAGKKTIILIAHRLSTLRKCDVIYQLEKGRITARGKYEELFTDH